MKLAYFSLLFLTLYVHTSNSMIPNLDIFDEDFSFYSQLYHLQNIRDQIEQALHDKSNLDVPLNTVSKLPALHEALNRFVDLHDLFEPLLQAGADPNLSIDKSLATPLHRAAMYDTRIRQVLLLLGYGAYVNSTGEDGQTPLIAAVINGAYKVATILLKHDANPNIHDKWGDTALHKSCKRYPDYENKYTLRQSMIKLLLYYGANPFIQNRWGKTALNVARENGFDELAQLMEYQRVKFVTELFIILKEAGIITDISIAQRIADFVYSSHA